MIIDQLCDLVLPASRGQSVSDVRVGLGYTAVQIDGGGCGLAYTFRSEAGEGCCVIREGGTLTGREASDLAEWARSRDPVVCAVGLATLNALIAVPVSAAEADLANQLQITSNDVLGMVGYFGPLVEPLRRRVKALHIFERRPNADSGVLPETAAADVLPRCEVVIISATTLLNRTLDHLLDLCRNAREVAVLGPSTPFAPEAFVNLGVTLLSGVRVVNPERVLRVVSEGGGTRQFGTAVKKLTLRLTARRS